MKLRPEWAAMALRWVRAHRHGTGRTLHRTLVRRFASRWPHLERDVWPPLFERAAQAGQTLDGDEGGLWGRGGLPALVLESAYWWAEEQAPDSAATVRVDALAAEVLDLDQQIGRLVFELAAALRRRTEIREFEGIGTDWAHPGLDFEDVIEATVRAFPDYQSRVDRPLREFLLAGRQTSASSPALADMLDQIATSAIGQLWASDGADRASLDLAAGSAKEGQAAQVRRFFGMLDEQSMFDLRGRELRPLDWLTAKGIATLLSVALGWDPEASPIKPEAVKKLRRRWDRAE